MTQHVTGIDEVGGIPVPRLPDATPAPHWTLEAISATERPRNLDVCGDKVVFIVDRDSSDLWVLDPDLRRLTVDRPLAAFWEDPGPKWDPTGSVVAYVHDGAIWLTDGGIPRRLCEGSSPVWLSTDSLIVSIDRDDRTVLALTDTTNGWLRPVANVDGDLEQVAARPGSTTIAAVRTPRDDLNASRIVVIDTEAGSVRELPGPDGIHDYSPVWSPDGTRVLFASEESGWYEVHSWDVGTDERRQVTADSADFGSFAWSEHGLAAIRTRHGVAELVVIDPDAEPGAVGQVTVVGAGGAWGTPGWTSNGSIVASHESPTTAPRLERVNSDGTVDTLFAPTPTMVSRAPHIVPEHVWYPAPGGDVPAFLYRPPGASASAPCPVIVHPHGGPTSHYGAEWDGVAQYFLDKGYAWLAPNFKGSTSYGRDHERANHYQWGVVDTADCLAAHAWMSTHDWVNPARIGIFGASYGSYMALASVVDGDVFACAIAKYGDCDILTSWAQGDLVGRLDLERMMGHPRDNPDGYRTGSPIHRIEQISAPILVAHGELDERVHPAQSAELVSALRRIGATYEYVTYPTEGHGFLSRASFIDFYRRAEKFLDWYLLL